MKHFFLLAVMLCSLAWTTVASAVHISAFASDWPDTTCQPQSVFAHYRVFDGAQWYDGGWSMGEVSGPGGSPRSYSFRFCPDVCAPPIPLDSVVRIDEILVQLSTGVEQYRALNHPVAYNDCNPDVFPVMLPVGAFTGCEEMQSAIGGPVLPQSLQLEQNYPNPFNPNTTIKFSLPVPGSTKLIVRNLLGQQIVELINDQLNAGNHEFQLKADNLPSGIYFYTLTLNGQSVTKQMLLLK